MPTRNTHNLIADFLSRIGDSIFRFLSRCEETRYLSNVSRCLKISVLGVAVLLITACNKKVEEPPVTYYTVPSSYLTLSEISVDPNPTEGAPTITIEAVAAIEGDTSGTFIEEAKFFIGKDTVNMKPADGEFNSPHEEIKAELFVGNYKPSNYELHIKAIANTGTWDEESVNLKISE